MQEERKLTKLILLCQVAYWALALVATFVLYQVMTYYTRAAAPPPDTAIFPLGPLGSAKVTGPCVGLLVAFYMLKRTGPLANLLARHKELLQHPVAAEIVRGLDHQSYGELFRGFTEGEFIAYNAPFRIERVLGAPAEPSQEELELHLERYRQRVTAKYLFPDEKCYARAVDFFESLRKLADEQGVALQGKITLQYWPTKREELPTHTYFAGYRSGNSRCILYPGFAWAKGMPQAVIVLDNAKRCYEALLDHFNRQWLEAEESGTGTYWQS